MGRRSALLDQAGDGGCSGQTASATCPEICGPGTGSLFRCSSLSPDDESDGKGRPALPVITC